MSLSDCEKCWNTPCLCGWDYRNMTAISRLELAANVLGINKESQNYETLRLITPNEHPKKDSKNE